MLFLKHARIRTKILSLTFGAEALPKPAAVIMAYTAHSDHSDSEPPTFVVLGSDDGIAPPASMENRIAELRQIGARVEYHKFPSIGHGFGAGTGTSAEGWVRQATRCNIPVDKEVATYRTLWNTLKVLCRQYSQSERRELMFENANAVYNLAQAPSG